MTPDSAIADVIAAAEQYAAARRHEIELEDARALVKSDAITRIMRLSDPQKDGKLYSATAAEALVMTDVAYASHRAAQADAVVATIRAGSEYEAAKFRAGLLTAIAEVSA